MPEESSPRQDLFELDLPVLKGIPVADLLRIRADHRDSFDRFKKAIQTAAGEMASLKNAEISGGIGVQISNDVVEPELRRIRVELSESRRALAKKSVVGVSMGALATTCGLLAGIAPATAVAGGTAAMIGTVIKAATAHVDEEHALRLSDMFFLWRAVQHLRHKKK